MTTNKSLSSDNWKSVDLDTIITLTDSNRILFDNEKNREAFFNYVNDRPTYIFYGAAFSHAKVVNLGIWGNDTQLLVDCARIMSAEFRKLQSDTKYATPYITPEQIMESKEFYNTYRAIRAPNEKLINDIVTSGCDKTVSSIGNDKESFNNLKSVYKNILLELYDEK